MPPKKKGAEESAPRKKSTKEELQPSRSELAAALKEDFNKRMAGRAEIVTASELSLPWSTKRLPTGLLTMDLELRGGFPASGVSQLVGPKNAGKSYIYWQVIRQLQCILGEKMCVLLAMTEMRADKTQGRMAGVEIALADEDIKAINDARLRLGREPLTDEEVAVQKRQTGIIDEVHAESAELLFDALLRAVDLNIYHLIVLDSVGMVMSEAESQTESLLEKTYGGAAKPITEFLRKLTAMLTLRNKYGKTRDTCIIVVNQIRDDIKNPEKPYRASGGRALEHAKFVDMYLLSGAPIRVLRDVMTTTGMKKVQVTVGKEVHWQIEKGKAGIHEGGRGSFFYYFDPPITEMAPGADFYTDTIVAGIRNDLIEQAGAWIGIRDLEDPDKFAIRVQGREAFMKALAQDAIQSAQNGEESWMNFIRNECFRRHGIDISYKWD